MRKTTSASTTLLAATLVPLLHAAPAGAQNVRSWVARGGSGNDCIFSQPCADFQTAITKTIRGGRQQERRHSGANVGRQGPNEQH